MQKPKNNYAGDITKVSAMDVCQTPPYAVKAIIPYLTNLSAWHGRPLHIWESAVGPERLIQTTLEQEGFKVTGTDLMYGHNFFDYTSTRLHTEVFISTPDYMPFQLTNMPFSIKYEWLKHSFELGIRFALLAPYETTFAEKFQKLFNTYNHMPWPIEVLSPERRIDYKMPNKGWDSSAQMPTAWITWGLDVYKSRGDYLRTYYIPMKKEKYA